MVNVIEIDKLNGALREIDELIPGSPEKAILMSQGRGFVNDLLRLRGKINNTVLPALENIQLGMAVGAFKWDVDRALDNLDRSANKLTSDLSDRIKKLQLYDVLERERDFLLKNFVDAKGGIIAAPRELEALDDDDPILVSSSIEWLKRVSVIEAGKYDDGWKISLTDNGKHLLEGAGGRRQRMVLHWWSRLTKLSIAIITAGITIAFTLLFENFLADNFSIFQISSNECLTAE